MIETRDSLALSAALEKEDSQKHILMIISGGISAYKACEICRSFQKKGFEVRIVMTKHATHFVSPLTFETLSGYPVLVDLFENPSDPIPHISYAKWAHIALIVPATANILAALRAGSANDAATSTLLALPKTTPLLAAPAMNVHMWQNPATQENISQLSARGIHIIEPDAGRLACGDIGQGKLAQQEDIVNKTLAVLALSAPSSSLLKGIRILITAGPTHEAIDPVRYIANASSGKMGFAIAGAAVSYGADVTLIAGPTKLCTPFGVKRLNVESAKEMYKAALAEFTAADIAICAAAVADYTPAHPAAHKLKKGKDTLESLDLVPTADILAQLSKMRRKRTKENPNARKQFVIGFAAETEDLLTHAKEKLERKACDLIVANDVSRPDSQFGSSTNHVFFVTKETTEELPTLPKEEVAKRLLGRIYQLFSDGDSDTEDL